MVVLETLMGVRGGTRIHTQRPQTGMAQSGVGVESPNISLCFNNCITTHYAPGRNHKAGV